MTAFLLVWLALCVLGLFTQGWTGPFVATGIMLVIAPFWFAIWVVNEGYNDHCDYSYSDC